jgi:CDP-L-myo-inositol myo-inositolphosphotransferase
MLGTGRGVVGGILAQGASVLDGVDGEVARLQVRARPAGAMLDGVLDRIADAAILAALGIWALSEATSSPGTILALSVAATAGAMLSMASKDRAAALGLPPAPEPALAFLLGGRDGRLFLVAVCAVLGRPALGLLLVAATSAAALALRLYFVRRPAPGG